MTESAKTSAWDKFVLLSWKNWVVQLRHPFQTALEILVPILVCTLLIYIRCYAKVTEYKNDFHFSPVHINTINPEIFEDLANKFIFYSPNNSVLDEIVRNVAKDLNLNVDATEAKLNASELEFCAMNLNPFASIEFDQSLKVNSPVELEVDFFHKRS